MIYQIRIALDYITPPIWRRIEISDNTTLSDLHKIIQSSMGWMNAHLHQFIIGEEYYSSPSEWDDFAKDYTGLKISDFLTSEGEKIKYEYDFGDSWTHQIKLEKIINPEKGVKYPRCIKGKRACPPEDCGGFGGYENLVKIMKNPKHPEFVEMYEWVGGVFDSEKFDLDSINEDLGNENYGVFSFHL